MLLAFREMVVVCESAHLCVTGVGWCEGVLMGGCPRGSQGADYNQLPAVGDEWKGTMCHALVGQLFLVL